MDRRVDVPMNNITFLEFSGLVFDAGLIFEGKLEDGHRASLEKSEKYFYKTISSLPALEIMVGRIYLSSRYICT